jgi:hypothetical protein
MTSSLPFSSDSLIFPLLFPSILATELVDADTVAGKAVKKEDSHLLQMLYTALYMQLQEVYKFFERNYTWCIFKYEQEKKLYIHRIHVCLSVCLSACLPACLSVCLSEYE